MPSYDTSWGTYSAGRGIRDAFIKWACDHGVQRVDLRRGTDPQCSLRVQTDLGEDAVQDVYRTRIEHTAAILCYEDQMHI